jgi:sphingoid base N-palmitoyltransferase
VRVSVASRWVLAGALAITLVRVPFQRLFSQWWKDRGMGDAAHPRETAEETTDRSAKAAESAIKVLVYGTFWAISVLSVAFEPFYADTRLCWVGHPNIPISPLLRGFLLGQMAWALHCLIALQWIDARRSDHNQMLLHHIVTNFLIASAYANNYHRVSGLVLLLFDVADVLLESGKICVYAGFDNAQVVLAILLLAVWWGVRCIFYPYKVFGASLVDTLAVLGPNTPIYWSANISLVVLWFLNMFWGLLIVRLVWRGFTGGKFKDEREDGATAESKQTEKLKAEK